MVEASVGDSAIAIDEQTVLLEDQNDVRGNAHERTPLLCASGGRPKRSPAASPNRWHEALAKRAKDRLTGWAEQAEKRGKEITVADVKDAGKTAVQSVPAVILGCVCSLSLSQLNVDLPSFAGP